MYKKWTITQSEKHYLRMWLHLPLAKFSILGCFVCGWSYSHFKESWDNLSCWSFLFYFSVSVTQAVEQSDCEKTQALALQVLLSLVKHNQHRMHEMECCHGYSMIHQVLMKTKCIVGYHILKVFMHLSFQKLLTNCNVFSISALWAQNF